MVDSVKPAVRAINPYFSHTVLILLCIAPYLVLFPRFVIAAQDQHYEQWQRATTLADTPKYGDTFESYDYVNRHAPKGGTLNLIASGSFDSFNPYIIAGTPAAGLQSFGGGLLYDTLMDQSLDQSGVAYAGLADATMEPKDHSWVKFRLNPLARWHDGQPITVDDVIWSFNTLRKISPYYQSYYAGVASAQAISTREVLFRFRSRDNRELPKILGDLVVLPRHWWEGVDQFGNKRDITKPTLEVPLGSGPYKIMDLQPGKYIIWQRVADYWGSALPQNVGRNNFDRIKYTYYMDNNAEWEAFKKGGIGDYWLENIIQRWQEDYNFKAVANGLVVKRSFPFKAGRFQAFFINTRLSKFSDKRVRKALSLALDFDSMNRSIYFGQYRRITSYFGDQGLSANGVPVGRELAILRDLAKKFPDDVPDELFVSPFKMPENKTAIERRANLTEAMSLLKDAGWRLKDNHLVDRAGQPFSLTILLPSPALERATSFYVSSLRRLGIDAAMRTVDPSQYLNRRNQFDFDIIMEAMMQSSSPGNEQGNYFSSSSADNFGSSNFAGIKNRAIDELIYHLIHAPTRNEVVATVKAMDRVLLWNYYTIPNWTQDVLNIAYWNKLVIPDQQPETIGFDRQSWWIKN